MTSQAPQGKVGAAVLRCLAAAILAATALPVRGAAAAAGSPAALTAPSPAAAAVAPAPEPTAAEAQAFVAEAERRLLGPSIEAQRAQWLHANFITFDTETMAAEADERLLAVNVELAKGAARFAGLDLPPDVARRLDLLKRNLVLAAPSDRRATAELARLSARLEGAFGAGKYCPPGGRPCLDLEQLSALMEKSRDPKVLLGAWAAWHSVAAPMRGDFVRLVELANQGARELGYRDTGAMWRSKYDMPADAFAAEVDRLWGQVKPLYDALHCYVRARLAQTYGDAAVPPGQPIPAHLLANMWAQNWSELYDLAAPAEADRGFDLGRALQDKGVQPRDMVRYGERFFVSLGFAPLPPTFWERSLFTQPRDRDVVCHASAWDIDFQDDLRIKMCIKVDENDFRTIHHELGHNFYQRAYKGQPLLYQDSANDGFHEAVGDTVALSVTPEYLRQVGLVEHVPDAAQDLGTLMRLALDKIAFLPFGLLVDQWRWQVFSGEVKPADYNRAWWELRRRYQGVAPPKARSESDFDPGAKYHVAANVPYTRYFLADILEFQLHRGLCQAAGYRGPLHRCSIYGNRAAGARLAAMLAMGQSRPWPEALRVATGEERMDAGAILDYFAPLKAWLDRQNQGRVCGW